MRATRMAPEGMEKQDYRSKTRTLLSHAELYQEFFALTDPLDFNMVKVKGHNRTQQKTPIDQIFTLVDRASRQALRAELEG
jgi:ribonuclease HI